MTQSDPFNAYVWTILAPNIGFTNSNWTTKTKWSPTLILLISSTSELESFPYFFFYFFTRTHGTNIVPQTKARINFPEKKGNSNKKLGKEEKIKEVFDETTKSYKDFKEELPWKEVGEQETNKRSRNGDKKERREKNWMKIKVKRVKKKQYIYVCKFDNFLKFPSLNENGEVKKPVEKTLCHFILINYNHIDNTCNHPAIQHIDLMKILSIKFENNNEININEFPSQNFWMRNERLTVEDNFL